MKNHFWRKNAAGLLALLIVSGGVPVQPFTDIFSPVAITASAASNVYLTDFLTVSSSGTATGYFTYSDHFYKVEWSGINTSETSTVRLYISYRNSYAFSYISDYITSGRADTLKEALNDFEAYQKNLLLAASLNRPLS